jgi:glycosyltransferase involved in cell wall biosynthesis
MASGLPVILSKAAGSAADLVREGWNGLLIPPEDIGSTALAMENLATHPNLCAMMGANSGQHISNYSPTEWCLGIARAVESVGGPRA